MSAPAAIGASGGPISRNAGSCVQCSSCPFGCEIDAKRGMHVSYLPRAVAAERPVDRVDDAELLGEPLDAEPVRDPQARGVVGEHQPLVVELDGYAFHRTRRAFERDRRVTGLR